MQHNDIHEIRLFAMAVKELEQIAMTLKELFLNKSCLPQYSVSLYFANRDSAINQL